MSNDKRDNLEILHKSTTKPHADYVVNANSAEGSNIKRHVENMARTYGTRYTTEVILRILEAEIKAIKQANKLAKKVS